MRKTKPQPRKTRPALAVETEKGEKRPIGRPPMAFDPIVAQAFLTELAQGEKSMRAIVESRPGFYPSRDVFWKWLRENEEFAAHYALAREAQMHSYIDDTIYLTDQATPERANVVRLQVDARRYMAERLAPKTYGQHIDHTHTAFVQTESVDLFRHLNEDERAKLREIITSASKRQEAAEINQRTAGRQAPKQIEGKAKRRA